jgi:hypothetical protein
MPSKPSMIKSAPATKPNPEPEPNADPEPDADPDADADGSRTIRPPDARRSAAPP